MNQIDLFTGEVNEHVAHVYARLPRTHANQKITGRIRGPFNQFAQTLPANATFRDLGPGDSVLARAVVTDPCTWSPDSPALYQVKIETTDETGKTVVYEHNHFGIKRFAARGKDLYLDGKRWVARGIQSPGGDAYRFQWEPFREDSTVCVYVADHADLHVLYKSSQGGVVVFVDFPSSSLHTLLVTLRYLAQQPSVFMAILGQETLPENIKSLVPNLLLAQIVRIGDNPAPWADVAWLKIAKNSTISSFPVWDIPTIVIREAKTGVSESTRAACDKLQADLAPLGQFAGYVV